MNNKNDPPTYTKGTKNVFKDLGLLTAKEDQKKAELMLKINNSITNILGLNQIEILDIINGKISKFNLNELAEILKKLSLQMEKK